jgi:hypothetical protein
LVALNVRHLQLTLNQPWNVDAIQKPLSVLKKVLQKPHEGFNIGFRDLHAKLDADTSLDFDIHLKQNETRNRKIIRVKTMLVHCAVSRGRLMQYACGSVTSASPLIFFNRSIKNNNSPGTRRYTSYTRHLGRQMSHEYVQTKLETVSSNLHYYVQK